MTIYSRAMAFISGGWFLATVAVGAPASSPASADTCPGSWTATDDLSRTLPGYDQVGPPRPGKYVGVFYFLWNGQHSTDGPYDITQILAAHPNAMTQPDNPAWGPQGRFHHWGEPLFGYYLAHDPWVLRKHAQMLADADVDVVIFDVTNQETYPKAYTALCEAFTQVRRDGGRTPQIAFLCPFGDPAKVVSRLYADVYQPGRYRDLWFAWKGKPLILADPGRVEPLVKDFFTFRRPQPSYFTGMSGPNEWAWLEKYPQHVFRDDQGHAEQMTVGIAQNGSGGRLCAFSEKDTYGRSWHNGRKDDRPGAVNEGLNFAEQWEHALKADPEFIFITGWNEWIALRLPEFNGVRQPIMFVDQYTQEYSRDVEPMKGGHLDNYYYQMIGYIRRFKGIRPPAMTGPARTIAIDGKFDDWNTVQPEYRDDLGDTMHRDHPGYDKAGRYVNRTGRNDFVQLKAAADGDAVYFDARTAQPISPPAGRDWMLLFIDADANPATGWQGYDVVANRTIEADGTTSVEVNRGGWNWRVAGKAQYRVAGNELELSIPRSALGMTGGQTPPRFDFKWADNTQCTGDIATFVLNGDTAPNNRFTYQFGR